MERFSFGLRLRRSFTGLLAYQLLVVASSSSLAVPIPVAQAADRITQPVAAIPASSVSVSSFLDETNRVRQENGLESLSLDPLLMKAAAAKAQDMADKGYWDHFRPEDHKAPWDFIKEAGYSYSVAGENLARGFRTAHGITEAWMASPTHRANLLSSRYKNVGFATVTVPGEDGTPVLLTVQMFGRP